MYLDKVEVGGSNPSETIPYYKPRHVNVSTALACAGFFVSLRLGYDLPLPTHRRIIDEKET